MRKNKPSKTCVACGLEKPMTAYLQITGPDGTSYGSVCSTCRGSGFGRKVILPTLEHEDNDDPTSSGLKIDSKTKVQIELDKREQFDKLKDDNLKEKEKKETLIDEKIERKEIKEIQEKEHRQNYLLPKKRESFLNYKSKQPDHKHQALTASSLEAGVVADVKNKEESVSQEQKKTTEDFSVQVTAPQTARASRESVSFKAWQTQLGEAAGTRKVSQYSSFKPAGTKQDASGTKEKNPAVEFAEKTWEPKTKVPPSGRR